MTHFFNRSYGKEPIARIVALAGVAITWLVLGLAHHGDSDQLALASVFGLLAIHEGRLMVLSYKIVSARPDLSAEVVLGWEWCDHCDAYFLRCPKCGNNTCNGGSGDIGKDAPIPCDLCPAIHEIAALWLASHKAGSEQPF